MAKEKTKELDLRIKLRGDAAEKLSAALLEKKKTENRNTVNNTAAAILLGHFNITE